MNVGTIKDLLTPKDYDRLSVALSHMEEIEPIERTTGPVSLRVWTTPAGRAWPVAMLVQAVMDSPQVMIRKNCASVEELWDWLCKL